MPAMPSMPSMPPSPPSPPCPACQRLLKRESVRIRRFLRSKNQRAKKGYFTTLDPSGRAWFFPAPLPSDYEAVWGYHAGEYYPLFKKDSITMDETPDGFRLHLKPCSHAVVNGPVTL